MIRQDLIIGLASMIDATTMTPVEKFMLSNVLLWNVGLAYDYVPGPVEPGVDVASTLADIGARCGDRETFDEYRLQRYSPRVRADYVSGTIAGFVTSTSLVSGDQGSADSIDSARISNAPHTWPVIHMEGDEPSESAYAGFGEVSQEAMAERASSTANRPGPSPPVLPPHYVYVDEVYQSDTYTAVQDAREWLAALQASSSYIETLADTIARRTSE